MAPKYVLGEQEYTEPNITRLSQEAEMLELYSAEETLESFEEAKLEKLKILDKHKRFIDELINHVEVDTEHDYFLKERA